MPADSRRLAVLAAATWVATAAHAQDYDTGWIDMSAVDSGEVVLVTGKPSRGTTSIEVAIKIDAPRQAIWDILTACEIAPEFVPDVVDCRRIDTVNFGKSELFIQTVKPAFFIPKFEHVFRLDYLSESLIEVHRVSGPIAKMDGAWRLLEQADDSILLIHTLEVQPGFPVPRFFVRATLRRDLPRVLRAVRERAETGQDD